MNYSYNIELLLKDISEIVFKDREIQYQKKLRGEKFNVFNVLGLWSEEVRLHSRFLSELLNPKGSHGLKDAFLKEFLICSGIEDFNFDTDNCISEVERYIGPVTEISGGRIDIMIRKGKKGIIIENKIYAQDQFNQLIRYNHFANKSLTDGYRLIYLTLNGNNASEFSSGSNDKVNYISISYKKTILSWLNRCLDIAINQLSVREAIKQYITLIKQLTNQNMEIGTQNQVIEIVTNNNNYLSSALMISSSIEKIKRKIVIDFSNKLFNQLNTECAELTDYKVNECLNISFKYKGYIIYFGEHNGKTYVSIKTEDALSGKEKVQYKLDFNSIAPDCWNPFGYDYCFDTNWRNNDIMYEKMLSFDNDMVSSFKEWVFRLKNAIDLL